MQCPSSANAPPVFKSESDTQGSSWDMPPRFPPVTAAIHHPGEETAGLPPSEDGPDTKDTAPKASPEELFLWTTSPKTATVKCLERLLSGMVPRPQAAPDLGFPCSPTPLSKNTVCSPNVP